MSETTTEQFRSLATLGSDVQLRTEAGQRILEGIAVPWNNAVRIDASLTEQFDRGAFARQIKAPGRIPLAREHLPLGGVLIGRVTELRDDSAGQFFRSKVSPTAVGDETLALIEDGALDSVSIGFRAQQDRRLPDGTTVRVRAELREIAVVMSPAYPDARILAVRSKVCPTCAHVEYLAEDQVESEHEHSRSEEAEAILRGMPALPLLPLPPVTGRSI